MKALALLLIMPCSALAQDALPPGLASAELMPGWVTPQGHRMTALRLRLEPGWKTYWRSPGDAGVPPRFDWGQSQNLAWVELHWPRPEAFESAGERTLGYHDELILPIEVAPGDPQRPVDLHALVDFGLCDDICVPAQVALQAPPPDHLPDPAIEAALARMPVQVHDQPPCRIEPIADGMRVTARIDAAAPEVAMELDGAPVWVSQPELSRRDGVLTAQADFVAETGKPFPLDPADLRLTLIAPDAAVEYRGCVPG